ncbi:MAG: hypothetical protein RH917_13745 [Lacipirellulaceae bacterium]
MRVSDHLEKLAAADRWNYAANPHESATEPAAWAALALAMHRHPAVKRSARWLAKCQQKNGSVGASQTQSTPRWPTSLATLAWAFADQQSKTDQFQTNIQLATQWSLNDYGRTGPRSGQAGHDTTLAGWSWAADTHSWLEPTCFFVRALTALGYADHPRVKVGVQMIADRLLPEGGCNYGNTFVLGQQLLPHLQPSGIAMWAIAEHQVSDSRIEQTLEYLERSVADNLVTPNSLSFALLGLTAFNRRPQNADQLVADHFRRLESKSNPGTYHQSLLLLAALRQPFSLSSLAVQAQTAYAEALQ